MPVNIMSPSFEPEVRKYGRRTTGHSAETWELLMKRAHALSSYALTCAAPNGSKKLRLRLVASDSPVAAPH